MIFSHLLQGQECLSDPADQTSLGVPEDLQAPSFPWDPPNRESPENRWRSVWPSEVWLFGMSYFGFSPWLLSNLPFHPCLVSPNDPEGHNLSKPLRLNLSHRCHVMHTYTEKPNQKIAEKIYFILTSNRKWGFRSCVRQEYKTHKPFVQEVQVVPVLQRLLEIPEKWNNDRVQNSSYEWIYHKRPSRMVERSSQVSQVLRCLL